MPRHSVVLRVGAAACALLLAACSDENPLVPALPHTPEALAFLTCSVDVGAGAMSCRRSDPVAGASLATLLYGGQELYVKLASSGTAYDGGTLIFSSNVTLQNLLHQAIGTSDGSTVSGVDVFFLSGPTVTSGTGGVTVGNADGTGTFTATDQPYFHYSQIIAPVEISSAKNWQFQITGSVSTFVFSVAVSSPVVVGSLTLPTDRTWNGSADSVWTNGTNWAGGVAPDSASGVAIPADSLFTGNMPRLTADAQLTYLRVGYGSTLSEAGFTLTAWGNVDAPGAITGGTLWMRGTGTVLSGTVNALQVSGSTKLQRATKATGAVAISGSLNTNGNTLTISIP